MSEGPTREFPLRVVPAAPRPMTVAEFNRTVKAAIEDRFASLWIEGEITALKVSAGTGHVYFDLKDEREEAQLSCVMWATHAKRSKAKLQNGERVQLKGRPSVYTPRGQFQFVAETALPTGAGAAAAALAALKLKLQAEGLFAPERKRALPRFPRTIGVVTSASGAAFHDICRAVHQRWPARIVLAPTLVQGADAPAQIVRAIEEIQRVRGLHVLIVGRGGGASEDLAAFNDERVARAIAACRVPVVSAVGHEVDNTVADLVADRRASTPTMAAEFCTPVFTEEHERLQTIRSRLGRAMLLKARTLGRELNRHKLRDPKRRTDDLRMRLDALTRRMEDALRKRLQGYATTLERAEVALERSHPRSRLAADGAMLEGLAARLGPAVRLRVERPEVRFEELGARLQRATTRRVEVRKQQLGAAAGKLDALSPVAILARGYCVVLHEGRALTDASEVRPGDVVTLRLDRGEVDARVERVKLP